MPVFVTGRRPPAPRPALVSNNPCQESVFAWLLSRRFFDNPHSVGLLTSPALRPHRCLRMYCHVFLPEKVVHTSADVYRIGLKLVWEYQIFA